MPRSAKQRRVCCDPARRVFLPESAGCGLVRLSVEELEALRLCDLEGLDQDACAQRMEISRGTFQRILYGARRAVAGALVDGLGIVVEGGNYQVASCRCSGAQACRDCPFAAEGDPGPDSSAAR